MAKQQTDTQERQQTQQDEAPRTRNAVATLAPPRLPYNPVFQERYGCDGIMWRALVDGVFPSAKTVEGVILAISYCKSKNYDVMKKMVHVVPIWSSSLGREVEGVWEGVAALRATAFRTNEYAGCDETKFGPMIKKHFSGEVGKGQYAKRAECELEFPEWAQITVYRLVQGQRCAFPGPRVYWLAAYGAQGKSDVPNDKWQEGGGSYMLEKCTEAAALRKAFPEALGGVNAAEEMEGRRTDSTGPVIDHEAEPAPPRPTRESIKREQEQALREEEVRSEAYRGTMSDSRAEPSHNADTGEIEEEQENDDTPDGPGRASAQRGGQQEPPSASPEETKAADKSPPPPAKPDVDYSGTAKLLIDKIERVGIRKNLDAILKDYAQEIEDMHQHSPESYEAVIAAKTTKIKWFAR